MTHLDRLASPNGARPESKGGVEPLPPTFDAGFRACCLAGETPVAWMAADLDQNLRYASSLVLLTDRRLLSFGPLNGKPVAEAATDAWTVDASLTLQASEHASVGALELLAGEQRLARWRYTAAQAAAAHRLARRFATLTRGLSPEESKTTICPSCGAVLDADQVECPACKPEVAEPSRFVLLRLVRFARPWMPVVLLAFALTLAAHGATVVPLYLTKPLLDDILIPHQQSPDSPIDTRLVAWYLGGIAVASVLGWLLSWGQTYVLAWVSDRIGADLRNKTYAHLQSLSLEYFGGKRTGQLIQRLSTDTDRICSFISVQWNDLAGDIAMFLFMAVILFRLDPMLALVSMLPIPLIYWLIQQVRNRLFEGFQQSGRASDDMTSILADTIPGVRVVKAFAQEQREVERFRRANQRLLAANGRLNFVWSFFWTVIALLTQVGLIVIWVCGFWRIAHNQTTVGTLMVFLTFIGRFYARLDSISKIVASTEKTANSARRIFEILDRVPSVAEPLNPVPINRLRGAIEFRGVNFKYGTRQVIFDFNLHIEPGEMIGLVGHSGAGKTTMMNLVCRFFDVAEGAILVDGNDIRSYGINDYRRHIGIVLQEPFLFFGTIAENIAYGRPDASREEIIAAAKAAKAHEFILKLPESYDSLVGERGQSLSGGERQRISIARALLIDPAILILDEATSSVDTETERDIQEALDNLVRGRTTIAIAHRLSTLRKADRLVVLERGRIVECGTHAELLTQGGPYSRLHKAQTQLAVGKLDVEAALTAVQGASA
jgi:ATP-binding cassette subfamily B protein